MVIYLIPYPANTTAIKQYDDLKHRAMNQMPHFDILVPAEIKDQETVLQYGRTYLAAKGLQPAELKAEKCSYCHMKSATALVEQEIAARGFAIREMENCA